MKEFNVILRKDDNSIYNVLKLKYDLKKFNTLYDISNYLKEKYNVECFYYECEYDVECKKKFIYHLAQKTGKIKLDIDFYNLTLKDYSKITNNEPLTINTLLVGGGYGAAGAFGFFSNLLTILDFFIKVISFIFRILNVYLMPFKNIYKNYGYGQDFMYGIISNSCSWEYGFLDLEKIKYKKILERSVMKKFGYKLKNKKWETNMYCLPPRRNQNKYDKY